MGGPRGAPRGQLIHTVIEQEKSDTVAKVRKEKEVEVEAQKKATKVDEASLDAQFGEDEKTTDVEQEEIKRDLSRDKKLEEKVQSEHKWIAA